MQAIGVIGAGQMGAGIAQVSAQAGYHVYLADAKLELAQRGKAGIEKQLGRLVEKEKIDAQTRDQILARIEPVADFTPMAAAGLVIEAATENTATSRTADATNPAPGATATVSACAAGPASRAAPKSCHVPPAKICACTA